MEQKFPLKQRPINILTNRHTLKSHKRNQSQQLQISNKIKFNQQCQCQIYLDQHSFHFEDAVKREEKQAQSQKCQRQNQEQKIEIYYFQEDEDFDKQQNSQNSEEQNERKLKDIYLSRELKNCSIFQNDDNSNKFCHKKKIMQSLDNDPNYVLDVLIRQKQQQQYQNKNNNIQIREDISSIPYHINNNTSFSQITMTQISQINIIDLILYTLPPGTTIKCHLKREISWKNFFIPQYFLYLKTQVKHLISAKCNTFSSKQIFKFYKSLDNFNEQNYLGSLYSNKLHNQYWLVSPSTNEVKMEGQIFSGKSYKLFYAGILYEKLSSINKSLQRKFSACISPKLQGDTALGIQASEQQPKLKKLMQNINLRMKNDINWSPEQLPSDKSFILRDQQDPNYYFLKLQKQQSNIFELEVNHPLSIYEAFGIALTRFDVQLK